jgi:hypothetical protein
MSELKGVYGSVIRTIAGIYIIGRFLLSISMAILRFIFPFFVLSSTGVSLVYFLTNVPKNQVAIVVAIPLGSLLILEKILSLLPIPQQPNQGNVSSVASMSQYILGLIFVLSALMALVPFLSYFLYKWMHINYLLPICSRAGLFLLESSVVGLAPRDARSNQPFVFFNSPGADTDIHPHPEAHLWLDFWGRNPACPWRENLSFRFLRSTQSEVARRCA